MNTSIRGLLMSAALVSFATAAQADGLKLKDNQTLGYGANQILKFNYTQNFDCVDQQKGNLDFDKHRADTDPGEMQIPICQAGIDPTINPPGQQGKASNTTDPLYVLVPMFSTNNDQNPNDAIGCPATVPGTTCGVALGQTLIKLFGAVPEAFKRTPAVYTQCPEPGRPAGTCTMHASRVDLAPVLGALGLTANPPTANIFVPTPNHSHVLDDEDVNKNDEWWQVIPVLVMKQSDWPNQDGTSGITSVAKMDAAEANGDAIEAPSNFFLFFGSRTATKMDMTGMKMH